MTLYYETSGAGRTVALFHCALCDGRQWDRQMETFTREFQVVRVDIPGFGRSPFPRGAFSLADDVLALLDELGIEQAALVGNSMGGDIAIDVTLAAPERVWALILVDAGHPGVERPRDIAEYNERENALLESGDIDGAVDLNLRFWLDGPHRSPDAVDPAVRARVAQMQRLALENYLALDEEPGPAKRPDGSPADIRCPTLVLVGDQDQPYMLAAADRYAEEIPGARKAVIAGAAHIPSLERPDEFDTLVLDFLRGLN
jgi:pimeloyl-ACP methyl ester carboxylesterase